MTQADIPKDPFFSIAAVERDTGLAKDTLRVWERRYGFPIPARDALGERLYSQAQLDLLRQVKRLIDQGARPGKLLADGQAGLHAALAEQSARPTLPTCPQFDELVALLRGHHSEALRSILQKWLGKQGLQRFVTDTVTPLNEAVGNAWMQGEIDVAEEHLYTEHIQNTLRAAINAQAAGGTRPRILLTTFPEELHSLGLLMAEAMLVPEGATCASLGTQTPIADIAAACRRGDFDIVALSFSAAYPLRQAREGVAALLGLLPPATELWVGSRLARLCPAQETRCIQMTDIAQTLEGLADWRRRRG